MNIFKVKKGTTARVVGKTVGYVNGYITKVDLVFEREDCVLDRVILHNKPDSWAIPYPELDALDLCLFEQHILKGDMVFHRDNMFLIVSTNDVERIGAS